MGHSLSGASPRPAVSLQVSAVGGLWRRRQCMKQAASSLAGHIRQSDALRGREGSWWSTLESGRPRQLQLGEEQTRKPWRRQLRPAACVYTSSPGHRWETGASVWRGCGAVCAGLGLFLPPLHFLLMTLQLLVLVQPSCCEVIRGK